MTNGQVFHREVGDILHLVLNLGENTNDLFARVSLIDEDDNLVGTISLPSTGSGLYEEHTETMPDVDQLKALYEVFQDAGFLVQDLDFKSPMDVFERDTLAQDIGQTIEAASGPADFVAIIADSKELSAETEKDKMFSVDIEKDKELVATIEDDELVASEDSDSSLNANLEC